MSATLLAAVRELPLAETLQLVEALWDDLARSPERILRSGSFKAEPDRRNQECLANPGEGSGWEEAKRRVLGSAPR